MSFQYQPIFLVVFVVFSAKILYTDDQFKIENQRRPNKNWYLLVNLFFNWFSMPYAFIGFNSVVPTMFVELWFLSAFLFVSYFDYV